MTKWDKYEVNYNRPLQNTNGIMSDGMIFNFQLHWLSHGLVPKFTQKQNEPSCWFQLLPDFKEIILYHEWASQLALAVKKPPATADMGLVSWAVRSPGGRHGNPLQDSCLENPMDRGAWWATVHGVAKSQTPPKRLSMHIINQRETDTKVEAWGYHWNTKCSEALKSHRL